MVDLQRKLPPNALLGIDESFDESAAVFPIHAYGSEEQKQEWLPRMAAGEALTGVKAFA